MKTSLKTGMAALLLLLAASCTKDNVNSPSSDCLQASESDESVTAKHIGDSFHGGIIFYLDKTGKHGLVAATADQGVQNAWNNGKNIETFATGTAIGAGLDNTNKIVAAQGKTGSYAALLCYNYKVGTYKKWYLPSKDELALLFEQASVVKLSEGDYWSSSETSKSKAWVQVIGGYHFKYSKSFTLHVRAISAF
ncbi:MAG TPA: hypothetical protein VFW07_19740 [Parafilimonas sp.]|nr:hypothetical protein [Parafilimonas sp.]